MADLYETLRKLGVRPVCRHCNKLRVSRPRGLCWACHGDPGTRNQYTPRVNQYECGGRRGLGNHNRQRLPLGEPTKHLPGTEEKVRVMERRAELGQAIFHPLDHVDQEHKRVG